MKKLSTCAKSQLSSLIVKLENKLLNYQNSNDFNIKKYNDNLQLLEELQSIYEALQFYNNHAIYTEIDEIINNTLTVDSEIDSFVINLNFKPEPRNISQFDVNVF